MSIRSRRAVAVAAGSALALAVAALAPASGVAKSNRAAASSPAFQPMYVTAPQAPAPSSQTGTPPACVFPDGTIGNPLLHCYTPQDIRSAYGVDQVGLYGAGQTIVLVDSYGSPTAAADLQTFHDTFFPNLPNPDFDQVFPLGKTDFSQCKNSQGLSGPCAAAGWSGEATLDIEWAYSIAPEAHIILLAVPPAETEGVQGFPNLFKAISSEIDATPPGTMFSMSLSANEADFEGAGAPQTAKFDQVFQQGLAKDDNFFAAAGDDGSTQALKQQKEANLSPTPVVGYPATSPYVVAVGGTQLQYGWTWDPTSNEPFNADGSLNPAYWNSTTTGDSEAVWNESWSPIATGGGASQIYPRPSWQQGVDPALGNHRLIPDTSWNAAVNGGVEVWITAYPQFNCGNTTGCWTFFGGTSAATPQTAALVSLANEARAAEGKQPLGFLDPILYQDGIGANDYTDIVPQHYGSAPQSFAGSEVGVSGAVNKSVGDLEDNQLWEFPAAGYQTTTGWDATTGWGRPNAAQFVSALAALP